MHNLEADLSGLRGAHNALKADHERLKSAYDKLAPDFTDVKKRFETITNLSSFFLPNSYIYSDSIDEREFIYGLL